MTTETLQQPISPRPAECERPYHWNASVPFLWLGAPGKRLVDLSAFRTTSSDCCRSHDADMSKSGVQKKESVLSMLQCIYFCKNIYTYIIMCISFLYKYIYISHTYTVYIHVCMFVCVSEETSKPSYCLATAHVHGLPTHLWRPQVTWKSTPDCTMINTNNHYYSNFPRTNKHPQLETKMVPTCKHFGPWNWKIWFWPNPQGASMIYGA